mgnify:CR=1 FL=1
MRVALHQYRLETDLVLSWALAFLIIAFVAGVLGFSGVSQAFAGVARVLFGIFLILFLVSVAAQLFTAS